VEAARVDLGVGAGAQATGESRESNPVIESEPNFRKAQKFDCGEPFFKSF
jgi:hypothetical protein